MLSEETMTGVILPEGAIITVSLRNEASGKAMWQSMVG